MKGLLIKDFVNLKQQMKILGLLCIVYLVMAIATKESSLITTVIAVVSWMLPITAVSYDEKAKWDRYALTMPISYKDLVVSKYLLYIVLSLGFSLAGAAISIGIGEGVGAALLNAFLTICVGMVCISAMYPAIFHFGVEKARFIMMIFIAASVAGSTALGGFGINLSGSIPSTAIYSVILVASIVIFLLSMKLSIHIYSKKEF